MAVVLPWLVLAMSVAFCPTFGTASPTLLFILLRLWIRISLIRG